MDILSDEEEEEDDDDVSDLYEEVTVHTESPAGQSATSFDFNPSSGLDQLVFASSLQKAASIGGGNPSFHAQ
jgi:hypothetical protein